MSANKPKGRRDRQKQEDAGCPQLSINDTGGKKENRKVLHTWDTAAGRRNCSRTLHEQNLLLLPPSCGMPSLEWGSMPDVASASSCRSSDSSFGLESDMSGDISACMRGCQRLQRTEVASVRMFCMSAEPTVKNAPCNKQKPILEQLGGCGSKQWRHV